MAISEVITTGRKYRVWDLTNSIWKRISFWTKASDVECNDGQTIESKIGSQKGITTSLNATEEGYAADATSLKVVNDKLGECQFSVIDGKPYITYKVGADPVTKKLGSGKITVPDIGVSFYSISQGYFETKINVEDCTTLNIGALTFAGSELNPSVAVIGNTTTLVSYTAPQSNLTFDVSTYTTITIAISAPYDNYNGSKLRQAQVTNITIE